jgi:hypothetical protein
MCFRLQVRRETPTLLGPLQRAKLNHWKQIQFLKRRVFQFLEYRGMDKIRNPSNSQYINAWFLILRS